MADITVKKLRHILNNALEALEGYSDNDTIKTVSNTYFLGGTNYLGCYEGFVDLDNLEPEEDDDWEDEDDDWEDEEDEDSNESFSRKHVIRDKRKLENRISKLENLLSKRSKKK